MKANATEVMNFAKVSQSTSIELAYSNLHITRKLYTDRGNNARSTMNWLTKTFGIVAFTKGNDAPRGGMYGNYVTFEANDEFDKFAKSLIDFDQQKEADAIEAKANFERMKVMATDFIANNSETVGKYKAKHGTNSRGLQVAAWKLSNIANDKGLKISKTAFFHSL